MIPIRVLLVDDSAEDRFLACRQLQREFDAIDIVQAASPADLDAALEHRFDVVITDYWLYWSDGVRVLRRIRAIDPDCPVIMYTGTGNEEVAVAAMKAGLTDYVVKSPQQLMRLATSARLALEGRRQRDATARADAQRRTAEESLVRRSEELERLNHRLTALSARLLDVQESERRRLARELHDEVGQALTALKLSLHTARTVNEPPDRDQALADAVDIADQVLAQVRDLSLDLRPSLLDDLGLGAAVRWYVERQSQRAGLTAEVRVTFDGSRLPHALETTCFRVIQEAMTNVIRHAGATRVEVDVAATSGDVELTVTDNGAGFDVTAMLASAVAGASLGLLGMQERVDLAGGRLDIRSVPGAGTVVSAGLPRAGASELLVRA